MVGVVGCYYLWAVRSAGHEFDWAPEQNGYYQHLGRAFAGGALHLPVTPAPELLAASNPWDPATNDSYKMHDMAFYKGRYYLYHGAAPGLLLFAPWRLLTRRDLPENLALFLFCLGGFLFSTAALLRLLDLSGTGAGFGMQVLVVLANGLCQGIPYLLNRVFVYEIAIGGGYFCISAGLYFFVRAAGSRRPAFGYAVAGTMYGMAIACRPHLGLVAVAFAIVLLWRGAPRKRVLAAYLLPLAAVGSAVALYNFSRFGSPFEFGTSYLLSGPNQNRIRLASANLLPGFYYFLVCAPEFEAVFPWVRIATRHPFDSVAYKFPPQYFIESIVGAFYLAPFAFACAWIGRQACSLAACILSAATLAAAGILLFLSATGFTAQRYEVDFLPLAVFAALANLTMLAARCTGWRRAAVRAALVMAVFCGVVVNLAIGLSGPYDEMLKSKPRRHIRIARWFTLGERNLPLLNPEIEAHFAVEFKPGNDGVSEPLFSMGHRVHRYFLNARHSGDRIALFSHNESSSVTYDLGTAPVGAVKVQVMYRPSNGEVTVALDGRTVLTHRIGAFVTAPSEVRIGEAPRDDSLSVTRFTGRIGPERVRIGDGAR